MAFSYSLCQCFALASTRTSFTSTTKQGRLGPISLPKFRNRNVASCLVQCVAINTEVSDEKNIVRRSANYQPAIWDFDYVESLKSEYTGEKHKGVIEDLKLEVRLKFKKIEDEPLALLEHIHLLQRLGLSYHFENEIKSALKGIYENTNKPCDDKWKRDNLYATALEFRLLRQHGFWVTQDVFNGFKENETGNFRASVSDDIPGLLSLYEASFHSVKGEIIMDEARDFCSRSLEKYLYKKERVEDNDHELALLVSHALDTPLHWKVPRLEARWFIDVYAKRKDKNPYLHKLAVLDFNVVQSKHQEELKDVSRWWTNSRLGQNLEFARDRLVVCFLWSVGIIFEPQFGYSRKVLTKVISLVNIIDDAYDVYGTIDELKLFTDAVERWNINDIDHLPDYLKICFVALHNTVNEMTFDVLKEQRLQILEFLKKPWTDMCKADLKEAKWFLSGYTPSLKEYFENSYMSVGAPSVLTHAFFSVANPITKEALASLKEYHPSLIRHSAMLLRLPDDLGTSSDEIKRGDNPKSIECYMREVGATEDEARQHVKFLISESWKQLNEDIFANSSFPKPFIEIAKNLGRVAQCIYQYGDGTGVQDRETKDFVMQLLVDPIPFEY